MSRIQPRHSPRHYPEFHAEFAPRGWSIFRTGSDLDFPTAHAVFAHTLFPRCVRRHSLTTYLQARPADFRAVLSPAANAIDTHATTCARCACARQNAIRRATTQ